MSLLIIFPHFPLLCPQLFNNFLPIVQFLKNQSESLRMEEFTDVLFKQLYETQPKIALVIEAGK